MNSINNMNISLSRDVFIYSGEPNEPDVFIRNGYDILIKDIDYIVEYFNNIDSGTAIARVSLIGDNFSSYIEKVANIQYEIEPVNIESALVTAGDPDEFGCYNLNNIKVNIGNLELVKNEDFKVKSYITEEEANYEITTVFVVGIGKNFIEESFGRFRTRIINPNLRDINDIPLSYPDTPIYYTGKPIKLSISLINNGIKLIEGKDYELTYPDDITNAGEKLVYINGLGDNYYGTRTLSYDILPLSIKSGILSCGSTDQEGNYNTENITVSFKNKILQKNRDYTYSIEIDSNDKFVFSIVTVTGKGNYIDSIQKTFRTALSRIDISTVDISLSENVFIYSGSLINPEIVTDLEYDKDYTTSIPNYSIACGEYKVIVYGKGNYNGKLELPYYITSQTLADAEVIFDEPDANDCYDLNTMVVKINGVALKLFVDYNYDVIESKVDEGYTQSECTIYGIGNYTGEYKITVNTAKKALYPGKVLNLKKTNIYPRFNSQVAETTKSGDFYVWSTDQKDGKIRITTDKEYVGQPGLIIGWINLEDIFTTDNIKIGAKVVVTGNINTYADGSGNTIVKRKEAMYIVDTLDPEQYEYCFGVASGLNRTRQGWATIDMIKMI